VARAALSRSRGDGLEDRTPVHRRRHPPLGPPHLDGTIESAYFLSANRGKHSICVDIATQAGADIVRSLVKKADVLIENYKVGDMKRYGLDYETLCLIKPDIVYCSITGYGQTGPMKTVADTTWPYKPYRG
jgi:crotonobetainyl-CoA:carnitine CoA-transferase CaiB-like acyl-CoA transferase